MKRLVIDASVLVSGIAGSHGESPPCLIYDALTEASFDAVLCPKLLAEVRGGLCKPYFRDRIDGREMEEIIAAIRDTGIMFDDPLDPPSVLRDPEDDYLVALALQAEADAIVTGDRDLLDYPGLRPPALHARAACRLLALIE